MAIALHSPTAHQPIFDDQSQVENRQLALTGRVLNGSMNVMSTVTQIDGALAIPDLEPMFESCQCGLALTGHGEAYNEEAFHHFLALERKRSEASTRPFLLLLVEFEKRQGVPVPIGHDVASGLFAALAESLRDTDVIGWYREQRVAGAVLTDLSDAPQEIMPVVADRVRIFLRRHLPVEFASLAQVRLYHLPARVDAGTRTPGRVLEFA